MPRQFQQRGRVLSRAALLLACLSLPAPLACKPRTDPPAAVYRVAAAQPATSLPSIPLDPPGEPQEPLLKPPLEATADNLPRLDTLDDQTHPDTLSRPLIHDPALAALVDEHFGKLQGHFGVAIKDLETGQGVLVNGAHEFEAASLFKLPVMYEVFRQRDAGLLGLAELLTVTPYYAGFDLGTLDIPVGRTVSVAGALDRMITRSDNTTAIMLLQRVGPLTVNQTLRELELWETRIGREQLTTSPRDMLHLLEAIVLGQGPSAASSQEMLRLLLDQGINDRLPARLPPDTPVGHKTGNLPGVVHDVGIVYAPGATFVIALLAENTPYAGLVAQAQAALTRAVYDYLSPPGRNPPPATLRVGGWGRALTSTSR